MTKSEKKICDRLYSLEEELYDESDMRYVAKVISEQVNYMTKLFENGHLEDELYPDDVPFFKLAYTHLLKILDIIMTLDRTDDYCINSKKTIEIIKNNIDIVLSYLDFNEF